MIDRSFRPGRGSAVRVVRLALLSAVGFLLCGLSIAADDLLDDPPRPVGVSRPITTEDVRRKLGLLPDYASVARVKDIKIAILDSGFAGVGDRPYLPKSAVVVEHYDPAFVRRFGLGDPNFAKPFNVGDTHGRMLAQLVWATTGSSPDGPQFYLLNANGPTLFRRAIRYAIEAKVDIILFSGTFEGAGNYDGKGPVNAAVDAAIDAGIIWVNAVGNSGGRVYNGPVDVGPDGFLRFRGTALPTALRFSNRYDENTVTITLTWNDYRETEDAGTDKDLDLIVTDSDGRVVGESKLTQVPLDRPAGQGESKNPRERLVLTDLPAIPSWQEYRIKVKARGNNFGPRDRIRIQVSSTKDVPYTDPETGRTVDPVEFYDASKSEEVYPPADHPGVLTVGDMSRFSAIGPTADGRVKPDVVLGTAVARFSNGEEVVGSSNAAAYFAGVVVLMRAKEPTLAASHIREWVRRLDAAPKPKQPITLLPSPPPSASPPAPPTPTAPIVPALTPNQVRGLRYAENAMDDKTRQKGLAPYIVMSSVSGTQLVQPGGRLLPGDAPPSTPRPAIAPPPEPVRAQTPSRPTPQTPPRPVAQFQPPPKPTLPVRMPPHALWVTPSPKALADLVRGP